MASWEPARLVVSSVTIYFGWTDPAGSRNCNPAGWAGKPGLSHFCPGLGKRRALLGKTLSGYYSAVVSISKFYAGPRGCQWIPHEDRFFWAVSIYENFIADSNDYFKLLATSSRSKWTSAVPHVDRQGQL